MRSKHFILIPRKLIKSFLTLVLCAYGSINRAYRYKMFAYSFTLNLNFFIFFIIFLFIEREMSRLSFDHFRSGCTLFCCPKVGCGVGHPCCACVSVCCAFSHTILLCTMKLIIHKDLLKLKRKLVKMVFNSKNIGKWSFPFICILSKWDIFRCCGEIQNIKHPFLFHC